jgi:hypothetical protein
MKFKGIAALVLCLAASLAADQPQLKQREPLPESGASGYRIEQGKRIPIKLLNTISLHNGEQDSRLYLQTVFPVAVQNHNVIPAGTYVDAKLTDVVRAGRAKDRAELFLRVTRFTMPNGSHRQLDVCRGSMIVTISTRGSGLVVVPGTTADIVLQDPIVFPVEPIPNR